ncbi:hypothetical protein DP130_01875 [Clostridium tetani]|uniref:Tyr recombinase domain-containing protein n=1 Tax=Clostridium tetani TaxID=1513 RepID=A0A4Q0VHD0_CLOTA|nr:hypothetical protein DP130_01875 [Clostridium tetani]
MLKIFCCSINIVSKNRGRLMLKANVHPKIVADRLGHSSVKMTLDTYSHILPINAKIKMY